jgi:amphiphysin
MVPIGMLTLEQLIDAAKSWQQAWADILQRQSAILTTWDMIYAPIVGADGSSDKYQATPQSTYESVNALKESYVELKDAMLEEVQMVQTRIVMPAKDAKAAIKPYFKVIKKREDRKLDYERYKGRVEGLEKKTKRSDRENTALQKHRVDLDAATTEYNSADDHLRQTLPGITQATYDLLPHLLNNQILIQNTLLAQLYTSLHEFSGTHGFPSPPPEFDDIVSIFESDFTPLRQELESGIKTIATGKAIRQPMALGDEGKSFTGLNIRNGFAQRRASSQVSVASTDSKQRPMAPSPKFDEPPSPQPPPVDLSTRPKISSTQSWAGSQSQGMLSPVSGPGGRTPSPGPSPQLRPSDTYFSPASHVSQLRPRQASATSATSSYSSSMRPSSIMSDISALSAAAGKKKPPPPPPKPKRNLSAPALFVTALYDFDGEGGGDLSFREGDRIRVVKKTGSENDWWEGELKGRQGSFPANYCRA